MTKEQKREHLTKIIKGLLNTNIELMTYYKRLAVDEESKKVCNKSLKQTNKALELLPHIEHLEILESLYNAIISGKEHIFVLGGTIICSKKMRYFDKTKKGFKEFLLLENEAKEKQKQEYERRIEEQETIKKAKEQGKKVEFLYDEKEKKVKPIVVD